MLPGMAPQEFLTEGFHLAGKALGRHGDVWESSSQAICAVVGSPKEEAAWRGQTPTHTHITYISNNIYGGLFVATNIRIQTFNR